MADFLQELLEQQSLQKKYPTAYRFYEKAKKMIDLEESELALSACRNALEALVKQFGEMCGVDFDTRETNLLSMVDALKEYGLISEDERALLHRTRSICNKGDHVVDNPPTLHDANEAFGYLEEIFQALDKRNDSYVIKQASSVANQPMEHPDYYSQNRRYYGKWAHCMTRNELLVIPEYVELLHKANDGDIQACLDIAVGFLPRNIIWTEDNLINMPPYI